MVEEQHSYGGAARGAWSPFQDLLCVHLHQMSKIMDSVGPRSPLLRNAANTIEAHMRPTMS